MIINALWSASLDIENYISQHIYTPVFVYSNDEQLYKPWQVRWPWPCPFMSSTLWISLKKSSYTVFLYNYFLLFLIQIKSINSYITAKMCISWPGPYCCIALLWIGYWPISAYCENIARISIFSSTSLHCTILPYSTHYCNVLHYTWEENISLHSTSPNSAATTIWLTIWIQRPAGYSECRYFQQVRVFT